MRYRLILLLSIAGSFALDLHAQSLPYGLDSVNTLADARRRLYEIRDEHRQSMISQGTDPAAADHLAQREMLDLQRLMEPKLRGKIMDSWDVKDSRTSLTGVERGGSNPIKGRGVRSDEDLQTKTVEQYEDLLQKAKNADPPLTIEELGPYRFKIKELDTIVWKPTLETHNALVRAVKYDGEVTQVPKDFEMDGIQFDNGAVPPGLTRSQQRALVDELNRRGARFEVEVNGERLFIQKPTVSDAIGIRLEQARRMAEDPEVALGARPGVDPLPSDVLERVLENTTKGSKALYEKLPQDAGAQTDELLAGLKDVWRSMQATGMCDRDGLALCLKMDKVRRGEEPLSYLEMGEAPDIQAKLQAIQAEAFQRGQQQYATEFERLSAQIKEALQSGADPDPYLVQRAQQMEFQLERMAVRFEKLVEDHPDFADMVGKTSIGFYREQMLKLRELRETAPRPWPHVLGATLNLAMFYECMQQDTPAEHDVRLEQTKDCTIQAAESYGLMLALEHAPEVAVYVWGPNGGIIASFIVKAGGTVFGVVGTAISAFQILDAGYEFYQAWAAENGAADAEAATQVMKSRNTQTFVTGLAAEEAFAATRVGYINKRRNELLSKLMAIADREKALVSQLDPGSKRLDVMLRELKEKMEPACQALSQVSVQSLPTAKLEADLASAEAFVASAMTRLRTCAGNDDGTEAQKAWNQAKTLFDSVALANRSDAIAAVRPTTDASQAAARTAIENGRVTLAQAANLWDSLKKQIQEASQLTVQYREQRSLVALIDLDIADQVHELKERQRKFIDKFSDQLIKTVNQTSSRLEKLQQQTEGLLDTDPTVLDDWDQINSNLDLVLINHIRNSTLGIENERLIKRLAACPGGGVDPDSKSFDDVRQRATRREQEAMTAFEGARSSCSEKLDNQPISKALYPLHLFRVSDREDPKVVPDYGAAQDFQGVIQLAGYALKPEKDKIEDLGQYPDKDSLCAVRRSFAADYPKVTEHERLYKIFWLGPDKGPDNHSAGMDRMFLICSNEGPVSAPVSVTLMGPTGGRDGSTAPPANRPPGFTVKSTSGVFISVTPPANAPKPLPDFGRPGGPLLDVGSKIETGPSSQVLLTTTAGTTITVTPGTKVNVSPPLTTGGGTAVDLEQGAVESSHTAGTPGFDDVMIRTPEGTVMPTGTHYRVERNAGGTDVTVSEGSVHLKGEAIYRLASPGQDAGKQAPATDMDLRAGGQARLVRKTETRVIDDLLAGPKTDPWNDSGVHALIDEWLRTAVPPGKNPQVIMRYNEWAQPLSQGATATGVPDHPADWNRYRYLWETRAKWTSTKLCTLGDFIDRRLANKPLTDCAPGTPPPDLTRGNKAIEDARQELAQTEATEKAQAEKARAEKAQAEKARQQQLAQATPKQEPEDTLFADFDDLLGPLPTQTVQPQPAASRLAGAWTCVGKAQGRAFDPIQRGLVSVDGGEYTTHVAIKAANGAFTFRAETDDEHAATVNGDTLRLTISGESSPGVHFDADWVLSQQGMVLTGTHHHRDGHGADYVHTLRCTPSASKK